MSSEEARKVIIIGGGPSGYTSAIYAGRANLDPLVIAGYQAGGQLILTTEVENFPGFPKGIMGPVLMEHMREQAERFGSEIINEDVESVDFSQKPFIIKTYDKTYKAHSVIITTGASARWLGLENEKELIGSGWSSCATCDGAFFKDKIVATIGGGDSAMEEATFLTRYAKKVYLIHRRDEFRASKTMQQRALSNPKIEVIYNSVVTKLFSEKDGFIQKLTGIEIENQNTGEKSQLSIDGGFVAIGHTPNTKIFDNQIELDTSGYIITKQHTMTSVEGVFAAGDVVDTRYRQAITAAGDGCRAAIDAEKWLTDNNLD
ncbi:MAG: thioredoxin-disulfide reductase [Candidatus Heimdallarchaeota archaeon]|nr:thioredoxin-disulfide reductase [Candidatus Heimdallarchaeota archaeon]MDH5647016.1 thioredoxin-disulfide reductase [Candidatus Heimdallarchaeota archaeon]